jgi:hypothetical protein
VESSFFEIEDFWFQSPWCALHISGSDIDVCVDATAEEEEAPTAQEDDEISMEPSSLDKNDDAAQPADLEPSLSLDDIWKTIADNIRGLQEFSQIQTIGKAVTPIIKFVWTHCAKEVSVDLTIITKDVNENARAAVDLPARLFDIVPREELIRSLTFLRVWV